MARVDLRLIFFGFIAMMLLVHLPLLFVITHTHQTASNGASAPGLAHRPTLPPRHSNLAVVGGGGGTDGDEIGGSDSAADSQQDHSSAASSSDSRPPRLNDIDFAATVDEWQKRARAQLDNPYRRPRFPGGGDMDEALPDPPPAWQHFDGAAVLEATIGLIEPRGAGPSSLLMAPPRRVWPPAADVGRGFEERIAATPPPTPAPTLPPYVIDESFVSNATAVVTTPATGQEDAAMTDLQLLSTTHGAADLRFTVVDTIITGASRNPSLELAILFYVGDPSLCPRTLLGQIDRASPAGVPVEVLILGGDFDCLRNAVGAAAGVVHRLAQIRFVNVTDPAGAPVVPNPWKVMNVLVGLITAPRVAFVGPGLTHIGAALFTELYHTLRGTSAGSANVHASPPASSKLPPRAPTALVGCTVRSAVIPTIASRASGEYVVARGFGVATTDGASLALTELMAGYAAFDARATLIDRGVAPSPFCFAATTEAFTALWPAHAASASAANFAFIGGQEDVIAGGADADEHVSLALHSEFLAFTLAVSAREWSADRGSAQVKGLPTADATDNEGAPGSRRVAHDGALPVVLISQHATVMLPRWTPTSAAARFVDPSVLPVIGGKASRAALDRLLAHAAMPSLVIAANAALDAGRPLVTPAPLGVVWDTFCIKCFGFSNEVMHYVVPLEKRLPMKIANSADCFCPGTPRGFSSTLRRLASPKSFEDLFNQRQKKRRAAEIDGAGADATNSGSGSESALVSRPLVWISHKDPGSFPVSSYGFGRLAGRPDIVIGRAMYEFNKLPATWKGKDQHVDEIWVPSRYVSYTFEAAGFSKAKLYIMPEPIDVYQYDPAVVAPMQLPVRHKSWRHATNRPEDMVIVDAVEESTETVLVGARTQSLRRHFKFFSVFKWESRKAWDVLLRAYFKEFAAGEAVSLYLVSYVYGSSGRDPTAMMRMAQDVANAVNASAPWPNNAPHLEIISEELPEADLIALYRSVDAFVLPTRGEGWGLPVIQAMSMALPTIATNFSGNVDFMTNDTTFLLRCERLAPVPASSEYGAEPGKLWAEPSETDLRRLMRHVFTNPQEAAVVGQRARAHIASHYSNEAVAELVVRRVGALSAKYAETHHAKRNGADALLYGNDKGLFPSL